MLFVSIDKLVPINKIQLVMVTHIIHTHEYRHTVSQQCISLDVETTKSVIDMVESNDLLMDNG